MNATEHFWQLVSDATIAVCDPKGPSTSDFEPQLLKVLEFVKASPEARRELGQAFAEMVSDPDRGAWEIIQFCMRELQWPEVHEALQREFDGARAKNDWRSIPVLRHILDVYEPDWQGADLYAYYSKR